MKDRKSFWQKYFGGKLATATTFLEELRQSRFGEEETKAAERAVMALEKPSLEWTFSGPISVRLSVQPAFFTSTRYLERHNQADWQHTDKQIQEFSARLLEAFRRRGIPLYVHTAYRSRATQNRLYREGRSKADWPRAPHCQGKAVDIVHATYHWDMSPDEWAMIGKVGKDLAKKLGFEITWGGDWSFYDPAHFELTDWRDSIQVLHNIEPKRMTPRGILKEKLP